MAQPGTIELGYIVAELIRINETLIDIKDTLAIIANSPNNQVETHEEEPHE